VAQKLCYCAKSQDRIELIMQILNKLLLFTTLCCQIGWRGNWTEDFVHGANAFGFSAKLW